MRCTGSLFRNGTRIYHADTNALAVGNPLLKRGAYILPRPRKKYRPTGDGRNDESTSYIDAVIHILRSIEEGESHAR